VSGGAQENVEGWRDFSGISFAGFTPRLSYLPFAPFGSGWYATAVEPGVEGWFQYYLSPRCAAAGGLKAALRLHAIGFGRLVPYFDLNAGAGGTGLDVHESQSAFTFVLEAGPGVSLFLAPRLAVNAGYRFQHFSNGNTSRPNRGYEAQSGVLGVSVFFP
jgi:opacity protein-like surface antigen